METAGMRGFGLVTMGMGRSKGALELLARHWHSYQRGVYQSGFVEGRRAVHLLSECRCAVILCAVRTFQAEWSAHISAETTRWLNGLDTGNIV